MSKYHFISGLPRAGTTLLSSILNQNPLFHASITDPLYDMVVGTIHHANNSQGMSAECPPQRTKDVIHGIFDGYYKQQAGKIVFNTNRNWNGSLNLIEELYPDAKIICCVRDIPSILSSFEEIYKSNPLALSAIYNGEYSESIYTRTKSLMLSNRVVGSSLLKLKEGLNSAQSKNIILVEYDHLAKHPEIILENIYKFLDVTPFVHDFDNVEASYDEYDTQLGASGLHTIARKVQYIEKPMLLPQDLLKDYLGLETWR